MGHGGFRAPHCTPDAGKSSARDAKWRTKTCIEYCEQPQHPSSQPYAGAGLPYPSLIWIKCLSTPHACTLQGGAMCRLPGLPPHRCQAWGKQPSIRRTQPPRVSSGTLRCQAHRQGHLQEAGLMPLGLVCRDARWCSTPCSSWCVGLHAGRLLVKAAAVPGRGGPVLQQPQCSLQFRVCSTICSSQCVGLHTSGAAAGALCAWVCGLVLQPPLGYAVCHSAKTMRRCAWLHAGLSLQLLLPQCSAVCFCCARTVPPPLASRWA